MCRSNWNYSSPLLNLVERLGLGNRDKDHNSLLSALDVDLSSLGDLELSQFRLEVGDILFEVEESLSNLLLNLGRRGLGSVGGPQDFVLERHGAKGC